MIAFEIVVTLVGALVTAFFAVSQIQSNVLRRQQLEHSLEMLDLAQKLRCDESNFKNLIADRFEPLCDENKHPVSSGAKFLTQELFDIIVFIGFSWWAYYLFAQGFIGWGIIAVIFALVGLMMALVTWSAKRQRSQAMERLKHGIDNYAPITVEPIKQPEIQTEKQAVPETKPAIAPKAEAAPIAAKAEATPKAEVTPIAAKAEATPKVEAKSIVKDVTESQIVQPVTAKIIRRDRVPEDSILRRHFLAIQRYEIESHMPPRPTDSILKRHYEHLLETKLQVRLAQMDA